MSVSTENSKTKLFNKYISLPVMHFPRVARIAEIVARPMPYFHFGLRPALLLVSAVTLKSLPSANHQPLTQPASSPTCLTSQHLYEQESPWFLSSQAVFSTHSSRANSQRTPFRFGRRVFLFSTIKYSSYHDLLQQMQVHMEMDAAENGSTATKITIFGCPLQSGIF